MYWFVEGTPAPQGSKRHVGNGRMIEASKRVGPWREKIRETIAASGRPNVLIPKNAPLELRLCFIFGRPKSHFRTGKFSSVIRDRAPARHTTRPDVDKLTRAVLDACTGLVYEDDSQVVEISAMKHWTGSPGFSVKSGEFHSRPGVRIEVFPA